MPPPRPMSISQLCQDDNLHSVRRELDQDPPDLYSGDDDLDSSYINNGDADDYAHHDLECAYTTQDSEQLAAEALGDMANRGSFVAAPFISRMSSLPIVNSALKAYESGKQNSKVMKYGAEMVESSVKSLSKPVFDKLEPKLGQLDDFACRQLDKVRLALSNPSTTRRSDSQSRPPTSAFQFSSGQSNGLHSSQRDSHIGSLSTPSQQFSGWRGVVATVGSASAAGVAIFSEESMKSLKYCLQWLQYAVQHIDHQIGLLRAFLVSLANPSQNTEIVPSTAASTLASIKKEVVETLRKVINVVSRYAGACLPDQAKINVRQFILSMPVRWATLNNESVPSTPIGSPSLGPVDCNPEHAALNDTAERATKVLVFANESSDMLRSVSTIFKDSVDKAESWMDKLRYVGMAPQNSDGLPSWAPTGFPGSPGGTMPGGFPGASGLEQYSLRQSHHSSPRSRNGSPTRSLKNSPRLGSRDSLHSMSSHHSSHLLNSRHLYRQKSVMSGDEDSASDEDTLAMDDSDDDTASHQSSSGHGPLKRSMGSHLSAPDNSVRRRKKRGESAEVVAGLGIASNGYALKQESF
ncbi:hypothetical protein BGZ93_009543 [Podila epicladia]|nr:hypothetical protein BGZ92_009394 [Podila epicladia]KAG0090049.1 hypothetical protein BGZ93_009543 [Podila epicladia]